MQYLLEISKILDGAVRSDRTKVIAYAEQLARKVEADGDPRSAKRIRESISRTGAAELAPNDFSPRYTLPVDAESRLHLADEYGPRPEAEPPFLAVTSTIKEQIEQFVRYVSSADKLIAGGVGISPSMLIYGPPGCGKTVLAKHIGARLGLPLLVARSDSLISSYLGSTAKNLRALFEHAMSRPCALFLDEFDAFAKLRDDKHELGELKRVVVSLLQNIDGLDSRTVLLAASNHEHLLDPAVWRRFAYKINLALPEVDERRQMFARFLGVYAETASLDVYALASESLNGSQIRQICEDATRDSILSATTRIDEIAVLRRILQSRLPQLKSFNSNNREGVRLVQELGSRVFTGKRLALLFNTSAGTISRRLRE